MVSVHMSVVNVKLEAFLNIYLYDVDICLYFSFIKVLNFFGLENDDVEHSSLYKF